jgi:hypothetical protein
MSELLKEGPVRKFLRERETLIPRKKLVDLIRGSLGGRSIRVDREVDTEIERMKAEKLSEWRERGYPEHLIKMGEDLAREWTVSMAKAFAPTMPPVQEAIVKATFGKGLDVADRWLRAMIR